MLCSSLNAVPELKFLIMVTVGEEIWMFFGLSGESSSA